MGFQKNNTLGSANKGRIITDEWRKKMSESHRGYIMPEEQKQKIKETQILIGNKPPVIKGNKHWNWQGGLMQDINYQQKMNRIRCKKWAQNNPEQVSFYAKEYYRRKKGAVGSHTLGEWELLKKQYGFICPCCQKSEPEIFLTEDHIIPLSKGGSNFIENIQPLCQSCNSRKNTMVILYDSISD